MGRNFCLLKLEALNAVSLSAVSLFRIRIMLEFLRGHISKFINVSLSMQCLLAPYMPVEVYFMTKQKKATRMK